MVFKAKQRSGMTRNVKRLKAAKAQQKVYEQSEYFDDEIYKLKCYRRKRRNQLGR